MCTQSDGTQKKGDARGHPRKLHTRGSKWARMDGSDGDSNWWHNVPSKNEPPW